MGGSVVDREAITAAFDVLDAAFDGAAGFDCEALTTPEQLGLLERWERLRRRIPAAEHPLINSIGRQATPEELGGKLSYAIAEWTLVSRAEASRRVKEAADLGPRHGLTGEPLAPVLAATAAAQRQGKLGAGQVADPEVLPPAARLDRPGHPRAGRGKAGPRGHPIPARAAGRAGRHPGRLP